MIQCLQRGSLAEICNRTDPNKFPNLAEKEMCMGQGLKLQMPAFKAHIELTSTDGLETMLVLWCRYRRSFQLWVSVQVTTESYKYDAASLIRLCS